MSYIWMSIMCSVSLISAYGFKWAINKGTINDGRVIVFLVYCPIIFIGSCVALFNIISILANGGGE